MFTTSPVVFGNENVVGHGYLLYSKDSPINTAFPYFTSIEYTLYNIQPCLNVLYRQQNEESPFCK